MLAVGLLTACDQTRVVPQAVIDASYMTPSYQWIEASDNDINLSNISFQGNCEDDATEKLHSRLEDQIAGHIVIGEDYLLELETSFYLSDEGFIQIQQLILPQLTKLYNQQTIIDAYNIE